MKVYFIGPVPIRQPRTHAAQSSRPRADYSSWRVNVWPRLTAARIPVRPRSCSLAGLDYSQDRIGENLRAEHDVLVTGILAPMMADATDRGHKQHGGRQLAREPLSVMPSAGWHADVLAGRAALRSAIQRHL